MSRFRAGAGGLSPVAIALSGIVVGAIAGAAVAVTMGHADARVLLAAVLAADLIALSLLSPSAGIVATMIALVALGLVRRLLIPVTGWSAYDPLLLVGPVVACVLAVRPDGGPDDGSGRPLPVLVVGLIGLSCLEVLNPGSGGILTGASGLLFVAAPLVWFFVGHRLLSDRLAHTVLIVALVAGGLAAVYGLWQSGPGLPPWDMEWLRIKGPLYSSLNVGGAIRAFGPFSSAAEYDAYLGVATVVALALILHGRPWLLTLLPLLGWALILESSRGGVVLSLAAFLVMAALRARRGPLALLVLGAGLALVAGLEYAFSGSIGAIAATTANPFVAHQLAGLADPLNPQRSTLLLHVQLIQTGLLQGLSHPLGLGPGATTLAALDVPQIAAGTEVDLSNEFVSLGIPGGLLYAIVVLLVLIKAVRLALARRDMASVALAGLLIVTFGQWLNGAYYAVSPLTWLLIGWLSARQLPRRAGVQVGLGSTSGRLWRRWHSADPGRRDVPAGPGPRPLRVR
jgi:hypothetical protein